MRSETALTNAVRAASLATFVDQYVEPVQPPMDASAFTPCACAALTNVVSSSAPPDAERSSEPSCAVTLRQAGVSGGPRTAGERARTRRRR
jgi:hypothetical protein